MNLRRSPSGEILTAIYKSDFDKITLKKLETNGKWIKVLYFAPNATNQDDAIMGLSIYRKSMKARCDDGYATQILANFACKDGGFCHFEPFAKSNLTCHIELFFIVILSEVRSAKRPNGLQGARHSKKIHALKVQICI